MQFLKILFWCLLAFLAAMFTFGNWTTVPIRLWANLVADVNLPFLLLVTFLAGFVPMLGYHYAVRWRLRQRLATAERTLADARAALVVPVATDPDLPADPPVPAPVTVPTGVTGP